jgi:hypothetical protein
VDPVQNAEFTNLRQLTIHGRISPVMMDAISHFSWPLLFCLEGEWTPVSATTLSIFLSDAPHLTNLTIHVDALDHFQQLVHVCEQQFYPAMRHMTIQDDADCHMSMTRFDQAMQIIRLSCYQAIICYTSTVYMCRLAVGQDYPIQSTIDEDMDNIWAEGSEEEFE